MGKEKSPARGLRAEALGMGVTLQKERQKGTAAPTRKTPTASRSAERAFTSEQRRHSVSFCGKGGTVEWVNDFYEIKNRNERNSFRFGARNRT